MQLSIGIGLPLKRSLTTPTDEMRKLMANLLCLLAAISVLDGHVLLIQSWAWANMLQDRIPNQGISQAVSTTFDGAHPCEHCQRLEQSRQESKEEHSSVPEINPSGLKLMPLSASRIAAPERAAGQYRRRSPDSPLCPTSFRAELSTPPPERA